MKTINSFARITNARDSNHYQVFLKQVDDFARYVATTACRQKRERTPCLQTSLTPLPWNQVQQIIREGYDRYRLRCRIFEMMCDGVARELISPASALTIIHGAASIIRFLVMPENEKLRPALERGFAWLSGIDASLPSKLVVCYSDKSWDLSPHDELGWQAIQRMEVPALSWNFESLIPANSGKKTVVNLSAAALKGENDRELRLTESQQEALKQIEFHFQVKKHAPQVCGISTRPIPLIVGPSGSGKTALIRHFCEKHRLPLMELNVGGWLVCGCKGEIETMGMILKFVREHEQGVLFCDELDKFTAGTDWFRSVQQETYALIDGRLSGFKDWTEEDIRRLKEKFFIIGAGTWQEIYKNQARRIGFGATTSLSILNGELERQEVIPEELLFRFNANAIELHPISKQEIAERVQVIRSQLQLPLLKTEALEVLCQKAVESRKNTRWLEGHLTELLQQVLPEPNERTGGMTPPPVRKSNTAEGRI
ncbi:MAG: AAA family ATPase [Verrucomicrobiae bacterium]|nr:AAA family ATPase [Verrucomicrobiae bacterium]